MHPIQPPSPGPDRRRRAAWTVTAATVAVLLAVAVVVGLVSAQSSRPATGRTLTVATWNMCGVKKWHCTGTGTPAAKQRSVRQLADDAGARVIFLQEACSADVASVRRQLGTDWRSAFHPYRWRGATGRLTPVHCAEARQGAAGIAILSASRLTSVRTVASKQPVVGLQRGILCASVGAARLTVCNAHLSTAGADVAHPGWEYRDDQLRELTGAASGTRVVYGGDFNLEPPARNRATAWIWPSSPFSAQRECDQSSPDARSGQVTHVSGHKIDYLFTGLPRVRCTVRDTGNSDHYALLLRLRTG
ncbi:endonuclease/exonuclease/phosphatase family protein [Streptomyces sp. VRA16 Mangrove soil]|uniref:endonuclease/exonuclease/phosphatase family protein n=1 Tax=Streptomyces sp. VRA16 Mangrove soil TaxID=2817434 RepID=UPI001A9F0708|nr:endonuclease/exonuclease/phosphatase family protein [Streptomyces sp. VRA16 Mangrove soil]MBO1335586.1 endonuclease/exonuclease/phosphatase family protein [Streptomyces sp. VRA16 Mangrove soil]